MLQRFLHTIIAMLTLQTVVHSQTVSGGFTFLPGETLFSPLLANYQEPRVGLRKEVGTSRMKLDIGSMLDVLAFRFHQNNSRIHLGIDFFTYALTTSSEGLRLQLDAVDGYFGGHMIFASDSLEGLSLRLRLLHLSAHFLDGHFDSKSSSWKDGRAPIPYTRDFGELVAAYEWQWKDVALRVYTGFSYATLIRPVEIKRFTTLHGIELHSDRLIGDVFGKPCNVFLADHLTLSGVPMYQGSNNIEFGLKFGRMSGSGVKLYASYFNGLEVFSQYYNVRREHWGLGFAFDFW